MISQKYVKVTIDSKNYQFFGEDDSAWSMADDTVIIKALKAGKKMTVVGYSKRGTETTDTYTLIGFTNAYNSLLTRLLSKMKKNCFSLLRRVGHKCHIKMAANRI